MYKKPQNSKLQNLSFNGVHQIFYCLGPIEGVLGLSWLFLRYYQDIICNQEMYTRSFQNDKRGIRQGLILYSLLYSILYSLIYSRQCSILHSTFYSTLLYTLLYTVLYTALYIVLYTTYCNLYCILYSTLLYSLLYSILYSVLYSVVYSVLYYLQGIFYILLQSPYCRVQSRQEDFSLSTINTKVQSPILYLKTTYSKITILQTGDCNLCSPSRFSRI